MQQAIFLQSEITDPYLLYNAARESHSFAWDDTLQVWIAYSYDACKAILSDPRAEIPAADVTGVCEQGRSLLAGMTRLSNNQDHVLARQVAMSLFQCIRPGTCEDILQKVLPAHQAQQEMDWVSVVAKQLPVHYLLQGFGFTKDEKKTILATMEQLVLLVQPNRSAAQLAQVNRAVPVIYRLIELQLTTNDPLNAMMTQLVNNTGHSPTEIVALCISNLTGLLIQSYHAGRGALSNALLFLVNNVHSHGPQHDFHFYQQSVLETLRHDPPVHQTRRIAAEDMEIESYRIKKGQTIVLVLAAANRDHKHFSNADNHDRGRTNNGDLLTFGAGPHHCFARHFITRLTAEALLFIYSRSRTIRSLQSIIEYEAFSNLRLPKELYIRMEN